MMAKKLKSSDSPEELLDAFKVPPHSWLRWRRLCH